jgi:hypothetical protein
VFHGKGPEHQAHWEVEAPQGRARQAETLRADRGSKNEERESEAWLVGRVRRVNMRERGISAKEGAKEQKENVVENRSKSIKG